jgi:hypothetical protein
MNCWKCTTVGQPNLLPGYCSSPPRRTTCILGKYSLYLCLSVSLSVSLYWYLSVSLYLCLCLSAPLSLCLSVSLPLCLYVTLSFCLSVTLSLFHSVTLTGGNRWDVWLDFVWQFNTDYVRRLEGLVFEKKISFYWT